MSIVVDHVTKIYGEQKALNEVSFEVGKGEIVGFLGPNGAGKSTMMKILCGFIPQTSGSATVAGYLVDEHPMNVKELVGYLPEHNPLYHEMYVRESLEFVSGVHKIQNKTQRISEVIEMVGLENEKHKKIQALSKGYRQRVGLAQALIHDPEVLILDEPTTGLDPNQLEDIRKLIVQIGKEKTVMLSTHIMQEVEAICSRAVIIDKGNIVANSSVEQLKSGTKDDVLIVTFDKQVESSLLKAMKNVNAVTPIKDNTWQVQSEDGNALRNELVKLSLDNDLTIMEMKQDGSSLENVFKQFTSKNN